jgi:hypothetical protein
MARCQSILNKYGLKTSRGIPGLYGREEVRYEVNGDDQLQKILSRCIPMQLIILLRLTRVYLRTLIIA